MRNEHTLLSVGIIAILSTRSLAYDYLGSEGDSCDTQTQLADCIDYACINSTCTECSTDSQCQEGDDTAFQVCNDNVCRTKKIFENFLWQDGAGTALIFSSGVLAAGAGIGGGGLYVPIFLILGWGKGAVVRSLASTTGLALALMCLVYFQRHPDTNRPAVDYRAMLVLEPIVLLGTIPGKMLNDILPAVIIYILLLVLLIVITIRSWQKYFKFRAQDLAKIEAQNNGADGKIERTLSQDNETTSAQAPAAVEMPKIDNSTAQVELDADGQPVKCEQKAKEPTATAVSGDLEEPETPRKLKRRETMKKEEQNPRNVGGLLILCWVLLLCIAVSIKVVVDDCGSVAYWVLTFLYIPVLWSFSIGYGYVMSKKHVRKVDMEFEWVVGDIHWTKKTVIMYPIAFFFAGLLASLLGIGGGMVIAPLLLEIGMHPAVANATTGVMTLFTASSATIQYMIQDISTYDYFLWYMCIALIAGLIGRFIINDYIKKTGKQSVAVFFLAILITGACGMTGYIAIDRIVSDIQNDVTIEISGLCD